MRQNHPESTRHVHTLPASAVATTGSQTNCTAPGCLMPLMYDGVEWRWLYDIDQRKRSKYRTIHRVNQILEGTNVVR